jgi:hypothetical protein
VSDKDSTRHQVGLACERLADPQLRGKRIFMFLNVSAIHQPNRHYTGADCDDLESHGAALSYVDGALSSLWDALQARASCFVILCSDHGTAYGEGGYTGHRHPHPAVTEVPYAHFRVSGLSESS